MTEQELATIEATARERAGETPMGVMLELVAEVRRLRLELGAAGTALAHAAALVRGLGPREIARYATIQEGAWRAKKALR